MAITLQARSISSPVWEWLAGGPCSGQVLAVFERTCLLETLAGNLAAVVLPPIGNGPLNVVVDSQPGCFSGLEPGTPTSLNSVRLRAGALEVSIQEASVWDPRPDWGALRARRQAMAERIPLLQILGARHGKRRSLLQLGPGVSPGAPAAALPDTVARAAWEGATSLAKGWDGDPAALQLGASRLAGLGMGLTPAGDDFLCGLMLWAWLAHHDPHPLCSLVFETARTRTTTLSAAFLRAAAQGECSAAWHRLLAALDGGMEKQIETSVREVLAHGSTSGADTLAGFLYLA